MPKLDIFAGNGERRPAHGGDDDAEDLLTVPEAAAFLRTSKSYLDKSRLTGDGPPFFRIGRKIIYSRRLLKRWLKDRQYRSTAEYD